ncbi:MAG: P-loop NTPase fold protein [Rhodospirillaceae bacterium]|nr:P-loop NTPase fold protein [Rhodospirillaceae bacterium]
MADEDEAVANDLAKLRERLLAPPRLTVASDLPLDHNSGLDADSFDLGYRLGPTYDILRNRKTVTPLAIAIRGEWGVGKTSAMRWLEARFGDWNKHLEENDGALSDGVRIIPVWFYPWKYQDREDVWRGLLAEVIVACLKHIAEMEEGAPGPDVKEQIDRLGFLGGGLKRLLKATKVQIGGGTLKATLDGAKLLEDDGEEAETSEADYLNTYESALENWIEGALGDDDRMVIFVDDLDRCLPEVALQVLEALKLYLNIEGVAFVLGIDRTVIDQLVSKHYKELGVEAVKSAEYLDKMFQVEVALAPSHREAGEFFDAVVKDNASWAALGEEANDRGDPQEIFRDIILDICRRSPREIKRLVNITLISAEGVEMSTRSWGEDQKPPTIAQGGQVALIQRVLQDRYPRHVRLVGDALGNDFFALWSDVVGNMLEANPDELPTCFIPENVLSALEGRDSDLSRDEAVKEMRESKEENLPKFIEEERFLPMLRLLTDRQLAALMRIPFSSEAATTVATETSQSAIAIVDQAIARQLGKEVNGLTPQDRSTVIRLNLRLEDIDDLRPITNLSSLQSLNLRGTQVSEEQVEGLKEAQPNLIIRI